jgi:hypothetical protein
VGRFLAAFVVLTALSGLQSQGVIDRLGPQPGQTTPGFRLPDQHGHRQTLRKVAGPKGTMVVFVRSADW